MTRMQDMSETTAVSIGEMMKKLGLRLATAESCTAGLIAATLASAEGASSWLQGGMVTYATEWKEEYLGVRHSTIVENDVVSVPVVQEMLDGVHTVFGVPVAIAVSGYAGPTTGNPSIPAGTVVIGVSVKSVGNASGPDVEVCQFSGSRQQVRERAVYQALNMLHNKLAEILMFREQQRCC